MAPKTRTEIQREHRQRKKEKEGNIGPKVRKSRAEIQKAYRERKKQLNHESFREKENERKKLAYIPTALLYHAAQEARRKQNRENIKRYRQRKVIEKKQGQQNKDHADQSGPSQQGEGERLIVKLNFHQKSKTRKRTSRAVSRAKKFES